MSIKEGLESTDVVKIKAARGTAKGQVTKHCKTLQTDLVKDNDKFLFDEIESDEVQELYQKLTKSLGDFEDLHARYLDYRTVETDATADKAALDVEESYAAEVLNNYSAVKRSYVKYRKALAVLANETKIAEENKEEEKKIAVLANETKIAKAELDSKKKAASGVVKSSDEYHRSTAGQMREELAEALSKYKSKIAEYKVATISSKVEKPEEKYAPAEVITADMEEVDELMVQLSAVLSKAKALGETISKETLANPRNSQGNSNLVKLQKLSCPKFSGSPRDFGHFKRDFLELVKVPGRADIEIGTNLKNAVPEKYLHLISHLSTSDHEGMMDVLEKRFGSGCLVIQDIVQQIKKMKPVVNEKGFIEFVEKVEQMKLDLEGLNLLDELANHNCISELESKLPMYINIDWGKEIMEKNLNEKTLKEKFSELLTFLNKAKKRVDYHLNKSASGGCGKSTTQMNYVVGATFTGKAEDKSFDRDGNKPKTERKWKPCLACNVDGATDLRSICHPMETCSVWNSLPPKEREKKVKCVKHPFKDDHTTQECTVSGRTCKICKQDRHHFLLCSKKPVKSSSKVSSVSATSLAAQSDNAMLPVMLQAQYVPGLNGSKIGTLMDLASTDDYVTHRYAKKHNIPGEDVQLMVEGMGGKNTFYETKVYMVPIMVGKEKYEFACYGMDEISTVAPPPERSSYERVCSKFGVNPKQMKRPESIDLLISMRQNFLHPEPVKTVDRLILYDGPLGKVFGGQDSDLDFCPHITCVPKSVHLCTTQASKTHHTHTMKATVRHASYTTPLKTEKELLEFFYEENIGVECTPRCGGCRCGKCATGAKQMTIKDERDYSLFKTLMELDEGRSWALLGFKVPMDS